MAEKGPKRRCGCLQFLDSSPWGPCPRFAKLGRFNAEFAVCGKKTHPGTKWVQTRQKAHPNIQIQASRIKKMQSNATGPFKEIKVTSMSSIWLKRAQCAAAVASEYSTTLRKEMLQPGAPTHPTYPKSPLTLTQRRPAQGRQPLQVRQLS